MVAVNITHFWLCNIQKVLICSICFLCEAANHLPYPHKTTNTDVNFSHFQLFFFLKSRIIPVLELKNIYIYTDTVKSLDTLPSEIVDKFTFASLGFPQGAVVSTCPETGFATYAVVSPSFSKKLRLRKWCLTREALTATLHGHHRFIMNCWRSSNFEVSRSNDCYTVFLVNVRNGYSVHNLIIGNIILVFRCVRKIWRTDHYLRSCLSAWNNSGPTGRIFMKFNI
jgi:hypothetical protein